MLWIKLRSKACRWEFGYVRKPALVHIYLQGVGGPRIVSWYELTKDAALCSQAFGLGRYVEGSEVKPDKDLEKLASAQYLECIQKFARTAEEQEQQAWCSMPLLEVAYAFAKAHFGKESDKTLRCLFDLSVVYQKTGYAERAGELGEEMLQLVEEKALAETASTARSLGVTPALMKTLMGSALQTSAGPGVTIEMGENSHILNLARILTNLSNACELSGDYARQKEMLERALRITQNHCGPDHREVAGILTNLANAHGHLGDHSQKKDMLEKALRMKEQYYNSEHVEVAITSLNLGAAYGALGEYGKYKDTGL